MSVKELELEDKNYNSFFIYAVSDTFRVSVNCGAGEHGVMSLDRNQADMLRLYLTEHLK